MLVKLMMNLKLTQGLFLSPFRDIHIFPLIGAHMIIAEMKKKILISKIIIYHGIFQNLYSLNLDVSNRFIRIHQMTGDIPCFQTSLEYSYTSQHSATRIYQIEYLSKR